VADVDSTWLFIWYNLAITLYRALNRTVMSTHFPTYHELEEFVESFMGESIGLSFSKIA
jgi:hypothetical protein